MLQQSYGKYIRDDGDALLREYVANQLAKAEAEQPKQDQSEDETETFTETFSDESAMYWKNMVVPTGIEPVLPT
jgi:hypothetical protein